MFNEFVDYLIDERGLSDTEIALVLFLIEEDYGELYDALSDHGYVDGGDREENREAMEDLADYYDPESIGRGNYRVAGKYYYIFDDEDEAEEAAIDVALTALPDDFYYNGWMPSIGIDVDWFRDQMYGSYEEYAEYELLRESSDQFENGLVAECYDLGLIDDTDFEEDEDGDPDYEQCNVPDYQLAEMYADHMCDQYADPTEWYKDNFGDAEFREVVEQKNLIDWREAARFEVNEDGIEFWLGRSDHYQHDYNYDGINYMIFKE